jgi:hypothetical protein
MSNHFHLLVGVPRKPEVLPSNAQLVRIVRESLGDLEATRLEYDLDSAARAGAAAASVALAQAAVRERYLRRMWDISLFMKTLKQRFTQWFNKVHQRRGTLWEDRFKSVLVESAGEPLRAMAAYIDLNPVRAGLVVDPKDYRWSGYGAAMGGDAAALTGLAELERVEDAGVAEEVLAATACGTLAAHAAAGEAAGAGAASGAAVWPWRRARRGQGWPSPARGFQPRRGAAGGGGGGQAARECVPALPGAVFYRGGGDWQSVLRQRGVWGFAGAVWHHP